MTYLMFLLFFVLLPLGILVHRQGWRNVQPIRCAILVAVATPAAIWWDHVAAQRGLWQWNDATTLPIRWWGLPAEEITFIIALVVLIVQWHAWLRDHSSWVCWSWARIMVTGAGWGVLGIVAWYSVMAAQRGMTVSLAHPSYLVHLMSWGMPILVLQWLVGGQYLWRARHTLILGLVSIVGWFSIADALALRMDLWSFTRSDLIGQYLGNVPIEEVLFFCIVTLLVEQAAVILLAWQRQGFPWAVGARSRSFVMRLGTIAHHQPQSLPRTHA